MRVTLPIIGKGVVMESYTYILYGDPTPLYMCNAIDRRMWDKNKEKKVIKQIEIERQSKGKTFNEPISINVLFYVRDKRYKSYTPTLKSYINFVEKIIYDTIIKKQGQIKAFNAEKKLSDANPRTEIIITRENI